MANDPNIPLMDHQLAPDEISWMQAIYRDFAAARGSISDPKEALRTVLAREEHQLPTPMNLTGAGPWRNGRNHHGRSVTAVFLPRVELHRHSKSRTDQFPMYVVGEADAFSLDDNGQPLLTQVTGGSHFHNPPNAPHAFLPKVGKPVPSDWEIAFIAITPRNLQEDTQEVSDKVRAAYRGVVGQDAPLGA
jgi:hypothetical protein